MAASDNDSYKNSTEEARDLVDSGQGASQDIQPAVNSAYYKLGA